MPPTPSAMAPEEPEAPAMPPAVPTYDLYGEAQPRPVLDPVHLETLMVRSHPHDWNIRPHRHRALGQVFWLSAGGGLILREGQAQAFEAPFLIYMPPGAVHGFRFAPWSAGHVLTLTDSLLVSALRLMPEPWPAGAFSLALAGHEPLVEGLNGAFQALEAEFRRTGPGRNTAMAGWVLLILSLLRRGLAEEASARRPPSPQSALVERFRAHLEAHFAEHLTLPEHCRRLGVTPSTLTRACRAVAGQSPLQLIQERLMLEARRLLAYTAFSVAEIAFQLGFDPAYFSRAFTRQEGLSPAAFRRRALWSEPAKTSESIISNDDKHQNFARTKDS